MLHSIHNIHTFIPLGYTMADLCNVYVLVTYVRCTYCTTVLLIFLYIFLTVHLRIILIGKQLDTQFLT